VSRGGHSVCLDVPSRATQHVGEGTVVAAAWWDCLWHTAAALPVQIAVNVIY
jgi:hypothetical protein